MSCWKFWATVTDPNIVVVLQVIQESSHVSVRHVAIQSGICRMSAHNIRRQSLDLFSYKIQTHQQLSAATINAREIFARAIFAAYLCCRSIWSEAFGSEAFGSPMKPSIPRTAISISKTGAFREQRILMFPYRHRYVHKKAMFSA